MPIDPIVGGAMISTGGSLLGMGLGQSQQQQQYQQQQNLMNLQMQNQMTLNAQGHDLQKKMWDYTNYENQRKHMEQAGLNVGLMYGQGGAGGTTAGSQSGGGASGGNAPGFNNELIGMGLQLGMQKAQIDLMKAQTEKTKVEAEKTAGVDTEKVKQEIANLNSTKIGQDIQNALNNTNFEAIVEMTNTNLENAKKEGRLKDIDIENMNAQYKANIANKIADTAFKKAQEKLTNQQEKESIARIEQGWKDLELKNKGLDIQQQQTNIQEFKAETERNYPNIMNVSGNIANDGLKAIYKLFGLDKENSSTTTKIK